MKQAQETEALKGQIKILIANAEAEVDPETMANLVVEKTPEESLDKLFDFLSGEDWFDQIILIVPEADAQKNWFTIWRDTVLQLLTVDDDEPIVSKSENVAGNNEPADSDISDTTGDIAANT